MYPPLGQLSFKVACSLLSAMVKHESLSSGRNISKWISIPIMDRGRDLGVTLALQRRKLKQIPERFVHGHMISATDP